MVSTFQELSELLKAQTHPHHVSQHTVLIWRFLVMSYHLDQAQRIWVEVMMHVTGSSEEDSLMAFGEIRKAFRDLMVQSLGTSAPLAATVCANQAFQIVKRVEDDVKQYTTNEINNT